MLGRSKSADKRNASVEQSDIMTSDNATFIAVASIGTLLALGLGLARRRRRTAAVKHNWPARAFEPFKPLLTLADAPLDLFAGVPTSRVRVDLNAHNDRKKHPDTDAAIDATWAARLAKAEASGGKLCDQTLDRTAPFTLLPPLLMRSVDLIEPLRSPCCHRCSRVLSIICSGSRRFQVPPREHQLGQRRGPPRAWPHVV